MKQVRFGKSAFSQLNGAFFVPKKSDFRLFRATFSERNRQIGTLAWKPCAVSRFLGQDVMPKSLVLVLKNAKSVKMLRINLSRPHVAQAKSVAVSQGRALKGVSDLTVTASPLKFQNSGSM